MSIVVANSRGSDLGVLPSDSIREMLDKVTAGSIGTSQFQLLKIVRDLPPDQNTEKILALALCAAMNIKPTVTKVMISSQAILPQTLKTGDDPNMSNLAKIGHLMFISHPKNFTALGLMKRKEYQESLGKASSILEFSSFREGSSKRTEILSKYKVELSNYNHSAFLNQFITKMPVMYHKNNMAYFMTWLYWPFYFVFDSLNWARINIISTILRVAWMTRWFLLFGAVLSVLTYVPNADFVPKTVLSSLDPTIDYGSPVALTDLFTVPFFWTVSSTFNGLKRVTFKGAELYRGDTDLKEVVDGTVVGFGDFVQKAIDSVPPEANAAFSNLSASVKKGAKGALESFGFTSEEAEKVVDKISEDLTNIKKGNDLNLVEESEKIKGDLENKKFVTDSVKEAFSDNETIKKSAKKEEKLETSGKDNEKKAADIEKVDKLKKAEKEERSSKGDKAEGDALLVDEATKKSFAKDKNKIGNTSGKNQKDQKADSSSFLKRVTNLAMGNGDTDQS